MTFQDISSPVSVYLSLILPTHTLALSVCYRHILVTSWFLPGQAPGPWEH